MTTIACPRCETTFETQATTATRCHACRSVVHVSRGAPPVALRSPRPARGTWSTEEADGETARTETIVIVLAIAGIAVVAYLFVRAWRRRKASGEASGVPGVPLASAMHRPQEPAVATCPLCTTGVARCAVVGCPMAA